MDFNSIVREQQAGLRAFIRALGADEAWVDDLAQEVFLVAYRKQGEFDQQADMGKWLRGIARMVVKGERSKQARRSRLMHHGVTDILVNLGQEEVVKDPRMGDLLSVMNTCVSELPDPARGLLQDRYHEGRQAKELADKLNSTAVAIRKKLQRIRMLVRDCMEMKLKEVPQ
jgi:RNA polymerase sigma-70 factor (ECF subfamily)